MLLPGDLGFPDLVLVFVFFSFFGVPIAIFIVRRKWRIAAARKEEIRRLIVLASAEAARAELEAAAEYGTVSVTVRQSQCVVCYCPTTTRCSRCKAVRYCSGKCQIVHWRQGHKDECYPPSTTVEFNNDGSSSGQKVDIEGRWCDEPMEAFSGKPASCKSSCSSEVLGKDDDKVDLSVVTRGTDNISESSDTSFLASFCTSTSPASVSEVSTSDTLDSSDGPLPDDMSHDMLETTANVKDTELTMPRPSESVGLVYPVNSFSSHSKLKHTKPSFSAGEFYSGSTSFSSLCVNGSSESTVPERSKVSSDFWEGTLDSIGSRNDANDDCAQSTHSAGSDDILFDSRSPLPFSFNLSGHAISPSLSQCSKPKTPSPDDAFPTGLGNKISSHGAALSEKMVTDVSGISSSPPLKVENAVSMDNNKIHDSQLLKSKEVKSIPACASEDNPSGIGRQSISSLKPTKLDTVITAATGVSEVASSSPSASNGLKTSVRKVVQQFRPSKLSKHYPLGFGSETAGKYSNKMLFPYELFIKLYHWDKVELRPCGLTNCGNSCFANAVLQCLAFTRPLTAFLLQGLHSKACPKNEWCFTCEFEGLILKAKDGKSPLSPIGILSQLQSIGSHLGHGREEDAHEFLRYAVDTMQSVFLKEARANAMDQLAEETTLVGLIFGGYLRSKIRCMSCQGKSERHERMMDLTVEIHGDIGTLEEALAQFTATEILDGENKYQCSRCKSYEKAKKKLTVLEAPNVLTIALKRFQSGKFGKLNKSVRFPEILNLAPYMSGTNDKSPIYQLYAVVVHLDVMNAAFSGHYVCYVKNSHGKWFKTDDSMVKPVELERVLSTEAYMLLYARCSPRAPSLSRNVMINDGKTKRLLSTHNGKNYIPKPRLNSEVSSVDATAPSRRARGGPARVFDSEEGRFYPINGIRKMDSSSDNSSLFSCSDEGSCSTESTRDSTSTDDLSDYIFGEAGSNWNSPLRVSSDSDSSASPFFHRNFHTTEVDGVCMKVPQESRREDFQGKENHPFLYSKEYRNLTNPTNRSSSSNSSSFRETDSERLGWVDPSNVKSGSSLRKLTRDRVVDQTFY